MEREFEQEEENKNKDKKEENDIFFDLRKIDRGYDHNLQKNWFISTSPALKMSYSSYPIYTKIKNNEK